MIDPLYLRDDVEQLRQALANRGSDLVAELAAVVALEAERRRLLPELENLKRDQNAAADDVAKAKRQGLDTTALQEANKARAGRIKELAAQLDEVEARRHASLLVIPNLPHASVPV
ncbi:MAG: serine--tRNA ligase, partial [Vicinamibacterales bacterium]